MNARLGVAVMAHRKREDFVSELVTTLDREATVVWDRKDDRWDTGSRAMLAHRGHSSLTHWMVVQDDAIVCRDLCAGVEKALDHLSLSARMPTPLCLYIGHRLKKQCRLYDPAETSWFTMPLTWGVGIVMPVELIDDVIRWGDRHHGIANYDLRIGHYLKSKLIPTWYPWPSMVDHRNTPSLVSGRSGGRHAAKFLGEDVSALDHDWTGQVVHRVDRIKATGRSRV